MSGISKISRLSAETREVLNGRLREGESGSTLLVWLNELPEVKELLAQQYGGAPVSLQNLSAWRQGGYRDWLACMEAREGVALVVKEADGMKDLAMYGQMTEGALTERLSTVLASKFAWVLANWGRVGEEGFEQELKALRVVSREVARLRKGDHSVVRLDLRRDWRQDYSTKQLAKVFENWAEQRAVNAWSHVKWADQKYALEQFWRAMGYSDPEVASIMEQPDRLPPWKTKGERAAWKAELDRKQKEEKDRKLAICIEAMQQGKSIPYEAIGGYV